MESSFKMEKNFIDIKKKSTKRAGKVKDKFNDVFNCCNENNSVSYKNEIIMQRGLHNPQQYRHPLRDSGRALRPTFADAARRTVVSHPRARHQSPSDSGGTLQALQGYPLQCHDDRAHASSVCRTRCSEP